MSPYALDLQNTPFWPGELRLRRYLPRGQVHPAIACADARELSYKCLHLPETLFLGFFSLPLGELFT
jgi:hypothetical protein